MADNISLTGDGATAQHPNRTPSPGGTPLSAEGLPPAQARGIPQKGDERLSVSDPSRHQHAGTAANQSQVAPGPIPAYMQATAQAAGEDRPSAGSLGIGVGVASERDALHGRQGGHAKVGHGFPAFDDHHPPDPELIADCVHCGFCLPTCPTYLLWGEEMDSPRGRIYLMNMASQGEIPMDLSFTRHIDQCLGCMACVTACPSGVQYDKLIETTRSQIERRYRRRPQDYLFRSMLFALFPHPGRLRATVPALWLYQHSGMKQLLRSPRISRYIPERLRGMEWVLPPVRLRSVVSRPPAFTRAVGPRRKRVGMLSGCVQRVFFDAVNEATIRVLAAEGCDVVVPPEQGCCGALNFHGGREEGGLRRARNLIDTFEAWGVDTVVVNAAGCGSTLKDYGHLLRDDPRYADRARAFSDSVRDISELLAELEPVAPRHPLPLRVAYHDACHLGHAQGIRRQPRAVLGAIPGLEVVDIPEAEICCGSAGIYNLVEPQPAEELGERKAKHILSVRPDAIATANPGCLLQITAALQRLGTAIPTLHPIELVDASIRGLRPEAVVKPTRRMAVPATPKTMPGAGAMR